MAIKASSQITLSCIIDIYAIYRYYKLQSSIANPPTVPTDRPPTGWSDTEPTYVENSTNSLYTIDLVIFSDQTWSYSMVQLSSSYEAAKAAYNKAQNAQNVVNEIVIGSPIFSSNGGEGQEGYVETITITYTSDGRYLNSPLKFYMNQRGIGDYSITFAWENTTGIPAIALLTTSRSGVSALAVKWTDYLCSIYIRKTEPYDTIRLMRIENPYGNGSIQAIGYSDYYAYSASDLISWTDKGYLMSSVDAECATNYAEFIPGTGVIVGDMNSGTLGKNVLIGSDGVEIRNGDTVLASFEDDGITFAQNAVFTADDIVINNSKAFANLGENDILWSNTNGFYMNGSQTITFSTNISRQISGAVFIWGKYLSGATTNNDWKYFFVPKHHVNNHGGTKVYMTDPYLGMYKALYVSNGGATGVYENDRTGNTNGIAYNNGIFTLRYVIGV